jgi:2-methylaconitate cis-trans-isomerase PrpF
VTPTRSIIPDEVVTASGKLAQSCDVDVLIGAREMHSNHSSIGLRGANARQLQNCLIVGQK